MSRLGVGGPKRCGGSIGFPKVKTTQLRSTHHGPFKEKPVTRLSGIDHPPVQPVSISLKNGNGKTIFRPEAPNVLFFGYDKKTLELPISARPPKKRSPPEKTLDHIPFFHPEEGGIVTLFF